jgi:hypothetical protein
MSPWPQCEVAQHGLAAHVHSIRAADGQLPGDFFQAVRQKFQNIFGLSAPLVTNIFPRPCHVTTVVGEPIPVCALDMHMSILLLGLS